MRKTPIPSFYEYPRKAVSGNTSLYGGATVVNDSYYAKDNSNDDSIDKNLQINEYISKSMKDLTSLQMEKSIKNSNYISQKLKITFEELEKYKSKYDRLKHLVHFINIIIANIWFLNNNQRLKDVIKNKFYFWAKNDNIYFAKHYHIIFDECLLESHPIPNYIAVPVGSFYDIDNIDTYNNDQIDNISDHKYENKYENKYDNRKYENKYEEVVDEITRAMNNL